MIDDFARYHRQMILPGVGEEGQARLARGHVLVVGLGALGCPAADLLCRAGVGRLTLVDRDVVELTNLQRQTLYEQRDADERRPKAVAAAQRLARVNPDVKIDPVVEHFGPDNAQTLVESTPRVDVIIDGSDNFPTRYLINDVAFKLGVPWVYGGAVGTRGTQATFRPGATPCLRCLWPDAPAPGAAPTCDTAGVLAPAASIIAACQAADAIKLLLGSAQRLSATLLAFDLWTNQRQRVALSPPGPDRTCACCGQGRFEFLDGPDSADDAAVLCGRNAVQIRPRRGGLDWPALSQRLARLDGFTCEASMLRGRVPGPGGPAVAAGDAGATSTESLELSVFADGRAIVSGTSDPVRARAIYDRYVGA